MNSLKSLKVAAVFFSYVRAGHKTRVPDQRPEEKHHKRISFIAKEAAFHFTRSPATLPSVILYSPPVGVAVADQDILLIFLERQVVVSKRHVVLQGDDHLLVWVLHFHLRQIKTKFNRKKAHMGVLLRHFHIS